MLNAILLLLVSMVSIQSGATLAKNLFPALGAAGTSSMRLFFATLILAIIFRPWRTRLTSAQVKGVAFYGLSLGLMNLLFYFALERIPLGIAVALEFTGPLTVAILASQRKLDYLWAVVAAVGIVLLLPITEGSAHLDMLGMIFAIGAGFFWALYIVFGKKTSANVPGGVAASYGMAFAALVVLPFGFATAGTKLFDLSLVPLAFAVGIFSSALPYSLEMISLKKIPASTFGVLMSVEPAIGALAGLAFLHEELSLMQWLAIACVMISSLGSSLTSKKAVVPPLE